MADQINSAAVKGEPGTGFEKAGDLGEFECGNCHFYQAGSCGQPDMMQKSTQPRTPDGHVKVDDEDCCEYVDRVGKKESPAQESAEGESPAPKGAMRLARMSSQPRGMEER